MVTLNQKELSEAMKVCIRAVQSRTTLPVLAHVKIGVEEDKVTFTTSDMEKFIVYSLSCQSDKEFSVCVDARLFTDLVNSMEDDITLQVKRNKLIVSQEGNENKLNTINSEEFPLIADFDWDEPLTFDALGFKLAIDSVIHASATNESRPILAGVLTKSDGQKLTLATADGFRMAVYRLQVSSDECFSYVIPANTLSIVSALIQGGNLEMYVDKNRISFCLPGDIWIYAQLLEGTFPDVERLLPTEQNSQVVLKTAQTKRALKSAMIFGKHSDNNVRFEYDSEYVITAYGQDIGDSRNVLDVIATSGEPFVTAVNGKYLKDTLGTMEGNVVIEREGENRPIVIYPQENKENHICVIMPMHIKKSN